MTRKPIRVSDDLSLPLDWITLATVVYGARGSGKTSLGRVLAEEAMKARQRFCAIDLKGDWWGLKSSADGKQDGLPVVVFGGDHQDVPLEEGAGKFVGETVAKLEQSCILDLEYFSKGKQVRFLTEFFLSLYDANREPLLLLLDEAQRYAPQSRMPDPESAKCLGAVEDLVKLGRKHGIGPVLFTQRGSSLNKEVSELCDLLVAFRTPGPLDQDRVKDWLDANTTKAQRDQVMGQLSGLATGTAVFASGHPDLKVFGVHAVRRPETFDSSATPKVGQRRLEPKKLAKPDLEGLREKMAAAIERAKADDPKALRAKIAGLEAELVKIRKSGAAAAAVVPKPGKTIKTRETIRIETPVELPDAASVESFEIQISELFKNLKTSFSEGSQALERTIDDFKRTISKQRAEFKKRKPVVSKETADGVAPQVLAPCVPAPLPSSTRATRPVASSVDGLGPGESAILACIIQRPRGAKREALTVLTDYKKSTRNAYLQRLQSAGLIEPGGDEFIATPAGRQAMPDVPEMPTGTDLQAWWLDRLPAGESEILRLLIAAYPEGLSRESISASTSFAKSTRNAYLQRMATRGVITSSRGDRITASAELFE